MAVILNPQRRVSRGSDYYAERSYTKVTPDQGQGVKVRNGIRSWRSDTAKGEIKLGVRNPK